MLTNDHANFVVLLSVRTRLKDDMAKESRIGISQIASIESSRFPEL